MSNWISIAALIVSITGLVISGSGYLRDRPRLQFRTRVNSANPDGGPPGHMALTVLNIGRRPVFLVTLWGAEGKSASSGSSLKYGGPGMKLGENESLTIKVTHLSRAPDEFDACAMVGDDFDTIDFDQLTFEDSTGKLYKVPKVAAKLQALRSDYKEWCERTGYWKTPKPSPLATPVSVGVLSSDVTSNGQQQHEDDDDKPAVHRA